MANMLIQDDTLLAANQEGSQDKKSCQEDVIKHSS